jgi:hypothetical protein
VLPVERRLSFFVHHVAKLGPVNTVPLGWPPVTLPSMLAVESWKSENDAGEQLKNGRADMQAFGITESRKPPHRIAVAALGWISILGGIVGLFIPVLPGGVLIFAGALMLSPQSTWLRRTLEKCRVRSPFLERALRRFCAWSDSCRSRFRNDSGDSGSQFTL